MIEEEVERIFRYKKHDIVIRRKGEQFQVGFGSLGGLAIWLKNGIYDSFDIAVKSGAEYARIVIERTYVREKERKKEESRRSAEVDREKLEQSC